MKEKAKPIDWTARSLAVLGLLVGVAALVLAKCGDQRQRGDYRNADELRYHAEIDADEDDPTMRISPIGGGAPADEATAHFHRKGDVPFFEHIILDPPTAFELETLFEEYEEELLDMLPDRLEEKHYKRPNTGIENRARFRIPIVISSRHTTKGETRTRRSLYHLFAFVQWPESHKMSKLDFVITGFGYAEDLPSDAETPLTEIISEEWQKSVVALVRSLNLSL